MEKIMSDNLTLVGKKRLNELLAANHFLVAENVRLTEKLSSLQEAARAVVDNVEHVGGYKVRKDLFNNLKKILEEQNDYK